MKLFVDKMPDWGGECIFAQDKDTGWFETQYICTLTNTTCDIIYGNCDILKELKIKVIEYEG